MLARIRKAMEEREGGFTLIELLVVVIIIGILAAIAIPVFLNQRKKGWDAQAKSDLKNMATAEETYLTDNGAYTAAVGSLQSEGFNESADNSLWGAKTFTSGAADGYCLTVKSKSGNTFNYESDLGVPSTAPNTKC
jgi:type IV pilus assembly protein PilA